VHGFIVRTMNPVRTLQLTTRGTKFSQLISYLSRIRHPHAGDTSLEISSVVEQAIDSAFHRRQNYATVSGFSTSERLNGNSTPGSGHERQIYDITTRYSTVSPPVGIGEKLLGETG
jgi:hypothetical protein